MKTIYLDDEYLLDPYDARREDTVDERRRRRGGTRQTKNICLMVALERVDDPTKGLIVATTHL
jgi:mRNA deadenylase 3'-5' endonuclease subunit Ccr4